MPALRLLHAAPHSGLRHWAESNIRAHHYLGRMPDPRTSVEVYALHIADRFTAGALVFGRPEATRCGEWYGSVEDALSGRCQVTRWQVLNLARVWIDPDFQAGGRGCLPTLVPGFVDRCGRFRSTLASRALHLAADQVRLDYLLRRPPCFLDEPYELRWLISYCDTALHRGTIYRAAGFELYRTNARGLQTWRLPLAPLSPEQDAAIRAASLRSPRSIRYRAQRAQTLLAI